MKGKRYRPIDCTNKGRGERVIEGDFLYHCNTQTLEQWKQHPSKRMPQWHFRPSADLPSVNTVLTPLVTPTVPILIHKHKSRQVLTGKSSLIIQANTSHLYTSERTSLLSAYRCAGELCPEASIPAFLPCKPPPQYTAANEQSVYRTRYLKATATYDE